MTEPGTLVALTFLAVSKAELPTSKKFKPQPKGTTTMSEQKKLSFMQELDRWTQTTIINPLWDAIEGQDEMDVPVVIAVIKLAIREKILESYRNGQAAGPKKLATPPQRAAR